MITRIARKEKQFASGVPISPTMDQELKNPWCSASIIERRFLLKWLQFKNIMYNRPGLLPLQFVEFSQNPKRLLGLEWDYSSRIFCTMGRMYCPSNFFNLLRIPIEYSDCGVPWQLPRAAKCLSFRSFQQHHIHKCEVIYFHSTISTSVRSSTSLARSCHWKTSQSYRMAASRTTRKQSRSSCCCPAQGKGSIASIYIGVAVSRMALTG